MVEQSIGCQQLTTLDGVSSELRLFPAPDAASGDASESGKVVLIFPAMGVSARNYDALAQALNAQSISVAIAELRGIGSSSVRASRKFDFGYHEMVSLDFPLALKVVREKHPGQKIIILGHSLGGQLASLMLAEQAGKADIQADALVLSASCSIYYRGWAWPRNLFILFFTQFGNLIAKVMGYFPGKQLNFGGREARTVIRDWAQTARTGDYVLASNAFDYEAALNRVDCPILAINYADDDFSPQAATEGLLAKMPSAVVSREMMSAAQLGAKRADHFSWLKYPSKVAEMIAAWGFD